VVDSEDVPLNLSREHLQDSALIKRLSGVLTKRLLKFIEKECKDDKEKFEKKFYQEFNNFLKEGICTDYVHKEDIAKLIRMESSHTKPGELTSFAEYISRMPKTQKEIFYLIVPNRKIAEDSPYYESFKEIGTEVLFFYDTRLDDFVLSNLAEFDGKKLKTIESSSIVDEIKHSALKQGKEKISAEEFNELAKWMRTVLVDKITTITPTERLSSTPLIIVDHESATFRRMMRTIDPRHAPELPKQQIQINTAHPIIRYINQIRETDETLAKDAIEQLFDNALIQAGLVDDNRMMVPRINKIIERALSFAGGKDSKIDYVNETDGTAPPSGVKEL